MTDSPLVSLFDSATHDKNNERGISMNTLPSGSFYIPTARKQIENLMRILTTPYCTYDPMVGNAIVAKASAMPCKEALKTFYSELIAKHAGCCVNYASALAYLMPSNIRYAVITSPENDDMKVSVAYVDDGELLVCDIVEYVKGASSIEDCSAIPYKDFESSVGGNISFFDVRNMAMPYVQALCFSKSNCSANALLTAKEVF